MLEFFRRYQRAFFVVITVVIVISFSFFGTFQTFVGRDHEDKVVSTAVDGSKILRSELNDMANFLSTDLHDLLFSGVAWSGNSLNDGVIANDIFESGIAQTLAAPNLVRCSKEQQLRLDREKRYSPYVHPGASFLSAEQIWSYYAPDVKKHFDSLRKHVRADDPAAFDSRVKLYVAQRRFPSVYLKQLLRRQELSHKWLPQDTDLDRRDLSLFGYHNAQDWFGRDFIELTAQFILNASRLAEQKGYSVSQEEALGSLFRNAEIAFKEQQGKVYLGVSSPGEFFQEQLRRLGMDQTRLLKTWTSILLFRQLFFDNAEAILVEPSAYKDFYNHLSEFVDIDLYQLPDEFCFSTISDVQKFALYLKAVRVVQDPARETDELFLPKQFLPAQEVKKVYPELVERRFKIRSAVLNKDLLQTKIGVKGTWEWQLADGNWKKLQERFPELQKEASATADSRHKLLDSVNPVTRVAIDAFSRAAIVDEHPEWIEEALAEIPMQEEELALRLQGGKQLDGIANTSDLIGLLETSPLDVQADALRSYTQDKVFYYRIEVVDRSFPEQILSFKEAKDDGTMDRIRDKVLEAAYVRVRAKDSKPFLKENGEWKPLQEVKDQVASTYFEPLTRHLDTQVAKASEQAQTKSYMQELQKGDSQSARVAAALLPYVTEALKTSTQNPEEFTSLMCRESDLDEEERGPAQWKLVKSSQHLSRLSQNFPVNPELTFSAVPGTHSPVVSDRENSSPCFFVATTKGYEPALDAVSDKMLSEKDLLGREAVCALAQIIVSDMGQKGSDTSALPEESPTPSSTEKEESEV
ncbi:MAG: hypothetical protein JSR46_11085 [Verrucomicrobia bacterium]|nr:hypothetical protein [Verrucomicrobiota bacterium]